MDLKKWRKQIMESYFPVGGLIIASFLGIFGFCFIMLSEIYKVRSLEKLYNIIIISKLQIVLLNK